MCRCIPACTVQRERESRKTPCRQPVWYRGHKDKHLTDVLGSREEPGGGIVDERNRKRKERHCELRHHNSGFAWQLVNLAKCLCLEQGNNKIKSWLSKLKLL